MNPKWDARMPGKASTTDSENMPLTEVSATSITGSSGCCANACDGPSTNAPQATSTFSRRDRLDEITCALLPEKATLLHEPAHVGARTAWRGDATLPGARLHLLAVLYERRLTL